ncbi:MAG: phosphoglucomutase/phosphomannomutase family protein [Bacteroidetes bacterium]|nr:MAG: phosphoglucomutase/phosphomannomutase family protein [Bacteroidota bacterium]
MTPIKFGTDGWRAIIAHEFTVDNVARVSEGTAKWLLSPLSSDNRAKDEGWERSSGVGGEVAVVLGHDCRFGGELFAETVAKVLVRNGIKVFLAKGFVSTPMISLGTVKYKATIGIIITASHNPAGYNGFKLKGSYGGPLLPEQVGEIEKLIPEKCTTDFGSVFMSNSLINIIDLESLYCKHVQKNFDLKAIKRSKMNLAYDAMYGAGQNAMKRLMPEIIMLHCEQNPSFSGIAPEPIAKNLMEISQLIKNSSRKKGTKKIYSALATDGDADRLGFFDSKGNFVDSHHIILLLIHYLCKYKKMKGKVVVAFSVTPRLKKMCDHYGLELQVVKIGFKYICGIMIKEDVLLGGEESGGIAIKGHIPERDGIWIGLTIWEFMAKSGKSLEELIHEVYAITGSFAFERNDLHLTDEVKNRIIANCKQGKYNSFGKYKVQRMEDLDGWKYYLRKESGKGSKEKTLQAPDSELQTSDEWFMIRASGTEPVLRTYAESSNQKKAFGILNAAKKVLLEQ